MSNQNYLFVWRRRFFWNKLLVCGHKYDTDNDKMVLYRPDGGIRELKKWSECEVKLGVDWALAVKESIKEEAGT